MICPIGRAWRPGTLLAACIALAWGCSGTPAGAPADTGQLKALGILYSKYVAAHHGTRPPSEDALRQFAASGDGQLLNQLGVEDPARLFVSPRNGEPLMVNYGAGMLTEDQPMAGYERQPIDGKRLVIWTTGSVMLIEEAEFQTLNPHE